MAEITDAFVAGAKTGSAGRLQIKGDVIYSFGLHFPLGIRIKRKGIDFIVNSDRYSSSTAIHKKLLVESIRAQGKLYSESTTAAMQGIIEKGGLG